MPTKLVANRASTSAFPRAERCARLYTFAKRLDGHVRELERLVVPDEQELGVARSLLVPDTGREQPLRPQQAGCTDQRGAGSRARAFDHRRAELLHRDLHVGADLGQNGDDVGAKDVLERAGSRAIRLGQV